MKLNHNNSDIKDFLLEDYHYLGETLRKNETIGESRINFFIGLVTAVITALVAFFTSEVFKKLGPDSKSELTIIITILLFALFSLLIIGIITLLRIVKRNSITDGLKHDIDKIRQRFNDFYDEENILWNYQPFVKEYWPQSEKKDKEGIKIRKPGGLAHMVAAINSLIISAITALIIIKPYTAVYINETEAQLFQRHLGNVTIFSVSVFVIVLLFHFLYLAFMDNKNKSKIKSTRFTHAGGIVVKNIDTEPEYLLVTAKKNLQEWLFPKGHIKDGENHKDTAIREIWEETGFVAKVLRPIGKVSFQTKTETVNLKFYLMEFLLSSKEKSKEEKRNTKWQPFDQAISLLTFPESREILYKADALLSDMKKVNS